MKKPPATITKEDAWGFLLMNVLSLPGLGTYQAGMKTQGVLQAAISGTGMIISIVWAYMMLSRYQEILKELSETGKIPLIAFDILWIGLLGLAVFFVGLVWAIACNFIVLSHAKSHASSKTPPKFGSA